MLSSRTAQNKKDAFVDILIGEQISLFTDCRICYVMAGLGNEKRPAIGKGTTRRSVVVARKDSNCYNSHQRSLFGVESRWDGE